MYDTDASQESEGMNDVIRTAMWHGNGGAEIAIAPVLFGLAGFLVDGALGIRPVLTIVGVLIGLGGAVFNQYFRYTQRMAKLTAERKAAHVAQYGTGSGKSFAMTEQVDLPTYVLASEAADERTGENA